MEEIISHAVIIADDEINTQSVSTGTKVVVLDLEFNEEETYNIVGSQEADPYDHPPRISEESPFGKALIGHCVNDVVTVEAPAGTLKYRIVSISK